MAEGSKTVTSPSTSTDKPQTAGTSTNGPRQSANGVPDQIGSRGYNGYDLTSDYSYLSDEISGSRLQLEELFGTSVKVFAYPYGRTDDVILQRISPWGYSAAVGTTWYQVIEHTSMNLFYLARFEVKGSWTLNDFGAVLQ